MKPLDRDLRDALEVLAGDPVADARRVLAALPPPGPAAPPPRGLPPIGWWMMGAGLVLGLGAGLLLAPATAVPPPAKAPAPVEQEEPKPPEKDKPPEPKPPEKDKPPAPWSDGILLMAFAPMAVDEPGVGFQELEPQQWQVADGTTFLTRDGQAGLYIVANDVRLRLDAMTRVRVQKTEVTLDQGRMWICGGGQDADIRVEAGLAAARVESGGCGMFLRDDKGLAVITITGQVSLRTPQGEVARLGEQQEVWIDPDRGMTRIQQVPFLGSATSWMTRMILSEQDDTELRARVKDMVAAYEDGAHREEAEREVRKLGSACVPMLAYGVEQQLGHGDDYARGAAKLISQIVDFLRAGYVLPLLQSEDAEVRVVTFQGLRRACGFDLGQSEDSWRQAAAPQRRSAAEEWRRALTK